MIIHCIIPARSGSQGVRGKNIHNLGKYPLMSYSIAVAVLSRLIEKIVVSTDSIEIAKIGKKYGITVPFLRPKEIAQDNSLDIEFFWHYIDYIEKKSLDLPDLIVHLRPTTPLREVKEVDEAIEYMMEHPEATALRSMQKTHLTPYKMFKVEDGYAFPFLKHEGTKEFYNLPRQFFEDTYIPNGYVDIIRPDILLNTRLLHGNKIKMWETEKTVDIDTKRDFALASNLVDDQKFKPLIQYLKNKNE